MEKLEETLYTLGEIIKQCSHHGKQYNGFKTRIIIWSSSFSSGYIYLKKELKAGSWRDICIPTFIKAFFTINQEVEATQVSTDKWMINKMWHIHAMECYSALKRKEILTPVTTWMDLKDIMLSEVISQSQKDKYWMILLTEVFIVVRLLETK